MHMEYNKLRNKINKFYTGGKIQKFDIGGTISSLDQIINDPNVDWETYQKAIKIRNSIGSNGEIRSNYTFNGEDYTFNQNDASSLINQYKMKSSMPSDDEINADIEQANQEQLGKLNASTESNLNSAIENANVSESERAVAEQRANKPSMISTPKSPLGNGNLSGAATGMIAKTAVGAMNAIDGLAMGDKNFGAQSQAIDSAVHGVSGALMSSGNPYAMIAGAALEGANFLTKAGGRTVQGYDVNIENSGYGNLGHMESSSSRDFGALIGLGGIFNRGAMEKKLARRNEQARMAMQAAEISEDIKFEQEARMNAVDNVLRNNQIALAGGVDLNSLGQ